MLWLISVMSRVFRLRQWKAAIPKRIHPSPPCHILFCRSNGKWDNYSCAPAISIKRHFMTLMQYRDTVIKVKIFSLIKTKRRAVLLHKRLLKMQSPKATGPRWLMTHHMHHQKFPTEDSFYFELKDFAKPASYFYKDQLKRSSTVVVR